MSHVQRRRASGVFIALAMLSALVVFITADRSSAEIALLPSADTIVLELEEGNSRVVYGDSEQVFSPNPTSCDVTTSGDAILVFSTTATSKQGTDVDPASLGLVANGLGSDAKGNGNGQDCGRVGPGESLTISLAAEVGSKAIQTVDWHFEGKFDAAVEVTYHVIGGGDFSETYQLNAGGSDSGPDAKLGDDYRVDSAPREAANEGKLFTGVTIRATTGEVALKGGIWPEADYGEGVTDPLDRTVFNLVDALDCGDSTYNGGPDENDTPWAAFYLGPPKVGEPPCAVTVDLTTALDDVEIGNTAYQSVNLQPTAGTTWEGLGVTGVLTIEWDAVEIDPLPGTDPIPRTALFVDGGSETIPWCNEEIPLTLVAAGITGESQYILTDYDPEVPGSGLYPTATFGTPPNQDQVCQITQETVTVELTVDGETGMYTITTEAFYIWDDPILIRPR
jgi:hypothetical protein